MKNPYLKEIIENLDKEGIQYISSIVAYEFYFGGYHSKHSNELSYRKAILNQFSIVPFTAEIAELGAKIESDLMNDGIQIGRADVMIAATVLSQGSNLLYTRNVTHFDKIESLEVVTW